MFTKISVTPAAVPCSTRTSGPLLPPLGTGVKALLVCPRFLPSFWSMAGLLDMLPADCFQPPLGLITVAALCPSSWSLRLVDRNCQTLTDADLHWADLVMLTGMAVQQDDMREVLRLARAAGTRTIVGGPFASSEPAALLRSPITWSSGSPTTCSARSQAIWSGAPPDRSTSSTRSRM
jgi:hypothetical protein